MRKLSKQMIGIIVITAVISVPVFIYDHVNWSQPVDKLLRNGYGEGDKKETLS